MFIKSKKNSNIEQKQKSESNLDKTKEKLKIFNNKSIENVNDTKIKINLHDININEKLGNKKEKIINLENQKNMSRRNSLLTELTSTLSSKRGEIKSPKKNNKKKKKKRRGSDSVPVEKVYLTEVNQKEEKKVEESKSYKYLKNKLEELKVPNNFQFKIQSSFDDIHKIVKDKVDLKENKKINDVEELINNINKNNEKNKGQCLTIGSYNEKDNQFNINKEKIHRLNNINIDNNYIKSELSKLEENKKILELCPPFQNDIIGNNLNNEKIKKINTREKDLLNKLRLNKIRIKYLLEENKKINRKQLIFNYVSNSCKNIKTNNIKTRNIKDIFLETRQYNSLNIEQKNFNRQLSILNKETAINKQKFQLDLELSKQKKLKQLDLQEQETLTKKENNIQNMKNCEKEFINKMKQKNDLILSQSKKYIKFKNTKKEKDYLFNKLRNKFENTEKKLIEKVHMIKKDPLVTKEELNELSNKIKEQKKILNDEYIERKEKMIKMWKERSQTIPTYRHPVVDIIEDEDDKILETEEEKIKQKEINLKEKKNYKPPEVKINEALKNIRENRIIKTTKETLLKTELNNKLKIKNKSRIKIKINKNNSIEKIKIKEKKYGPPHPKPDKPIDYLKSIIKKNKNINKKDCGIGLYNINEDIDKKNELTISEYVELAKSKNKIIDKKVEEKKLYLKVKGGYLLNTNLGDEVGNLLIGSIKSKLNILKRLNGK